MMQTISIPQTVVLNKIFPHCIANEGLSAFQRLVCVNKRVKEVASNNISFWLHWLESQRERWIRERSEGGGAKNIVAEFLRKNYVLIPRSILESHGLLALIQSKRRGRFMLCGWGTKITRKRVVEGFFHNGVLCTAMPHIMYGETNQKTLFRQERNLSSFTFLFPSGWVFEGVLNPIVGVLRRGEETIQIVQHLLTRQQKEKLGAAAAEQQFFRASTVGHSRLPVREGWLCFQGTFLFRHVSEFQITRLCPMQLGAFL